MLRDSRIFVFEIREANKLGVHHFLLDLVKSQPEEVVVDSARASVGI